ncbi:hypothetical protein CC80DRAFT_561510 [Byssothecium circinans]|uniref:Uncharacterized protein n=1 Tax=Byssothecium circinans TaxID=147558 RepID=A0A6A5TWN7_9PLEO|nr:hypothetical protein CC80DRAFT_561510 [Byssothecium circinans]
MSRAPTGPVCNKSKSKECTTCPKAILIKSPGVANCDPKKQKCPTNTSLRPSNPSSKASNKPTATLKASANPTVQPKPTAQPKSPKTPCTPKHGKTCKRHEAEDEEAKLDEKLSFEQLNINDGTPVNELVSRADYTVAMFDTKAEDWLPGFSIMTKDLSVCSVVAVWDNLRIIMSHIPPGEPTANGDVLDNAATLRLYLGRIDAEMARTPLVAPKSGYFLVRESMDATDKEIVRNWAIGHGISLITRPYKFQGPPGAKLTLRRPATGNGPIAHDLENLEKV